MKKLTISLLVALQICSPALAAETAETVDPVASIFEEAAAISEPQTIQFLLGAPVAELEKNSGSDSEFLYQVLVNRLNSDFAVAENLVSWATAMTVFLVVLFLVATILQYFYFRRRAKSEIGKIRHLAKEKMEDLRKECDLRENNLQSIVDQQQRVLEELKQVVEQKSSQLPE